MELAEIRRALDLPEIVHSMRNAVIAYSRGECEMPMPMYLTIGTNEVHMKSSYRRGGKYFVLKIAGTFQGVGNGMMLLSSAETGEPVAYLADGGHLTDVRTAAVAGLAARELGRRDRVLGILGTGIQARLLAQLHAEIMELAGIVIWGRNPARAEDCRRELQALMPDTEISIAESPAAVASRARLIATATASREPLLFARDLQPGTHISAVGADSPGKQELDPEILRSASLLLVDSRRQCEKLGELQHAPDLWGRAMELGEALGKAAMPESNGNSICDFTGLGVEDLYIAEYCYERAI